ncbi:MAG: hypothetical protein HY698_17995 [Deltaproteobacteria bacterium]|nr:hypothetical protein [Deltaproteobacteria bacterium]
MRKSFVVGLLMLTACGGSQKGQLSGDGAGEIGESSGDGDLRIPKVDTTLCDASGKQVAQFDLNRDNKPDVWKLFKTTEQKGTTIQVLTCKQADLDHDGRKDYVAQYDDSGALLIEEQDFDFDGKFDARYHYDRKTGNRYLVERETGFDNKPDIWEKYDKEGRLQSVRRDRNADGKPDYWEQYTAGVLDAILYDDDYDGKVDRQDDARPKASPQAEPSSAPVGAPAPSAGG